jgi:hypothetical protein
MARKANLNLSIEAADVKALNGIQNSLKSRPEMRPNPTSGTEIPLLSYYLFTFSCFEGCGIISATQISFTSEDLVKRPRDI